MSCRETAISRRFVKKGRQNLLGKTYLDGAVALEGLNVSVGGLAEFILSVVLALSDGWDDSWGSQDRWSSYDGWGNEAPGETTNATNYNHFTIQNLPK